MVTSPAKCGHQRDDVTIILYIYILYIYIYIYIYIHCMINILTISSLVEILLSFTLSMMQTERTTKSILFIHLCRYDLS